MGRTLLDKIWDAHTVRVEDGGRCVLYIDRQYFGNQRIIRCCKIINYKRSGKQ